MGQQLFQLARRSAAEQVSSPEQIGEDEAVALDDLTDAGDALNVSAQPSAAGTGLGTAPTAAGVQPAAATGGTGGVLRLLQTGRIQQYVFLIVAGTVVLVAGFIIF